MTRALLCGLILAPALAGAQTASCPLSVDEGTITVKAPSGWQATASIAHLGSAGMTRGNPRRLGYLIPDKTKQIRGAAVDTWHFDKGEEKWLWCGYGMEAIQLSKRMDDATTSCQLTGKEERKGVYVEMTLVCK